MFLNFKIYKIEIIIQNMYSRDGHNIEERSDSFVDDIMDGI